MKPTIDFKRFFYLKDTITTDNHLLFSFCHLLSGVITNWDDELLNYPISDLINSDFTEEHIYMITSIFELHHGIDIPEDYLDFCLTFRQFIDKVTLLPKISPAEYKIHLDEMRVAGQKLLN